MKKTMMRLLAVILTVAMLCSMLPIMASAQENVQAPQEISKKSEAIIEADIWDKIERFEDENLIATRDDPITATDYAELSDEIEALVKQSDTFVEGTVNRNGDFFTWETTEGIPCCYSPALRFKLRENAETGNDNTTVMNFATKAAPSDKDVFLIAPYYGYDSSFTNQYKNEASSIASATGGKYTLYEGTNATITNIANAFQNGGVVIFDSHGITDYQNGEDYVSRANSSYLCLKSSSGLTTSDTQAVSGTYGTYYHAMNGGSGTYCVDGTAIKNHMSKAAPGTILWMAICLGMATSGLCTPMRNAGCEVVYGYSQSVSFTGDYKYETYFWNKMKAGSDVATAISYMKSAAGCNWDPAYPNLSLSSAKANYVAFPIVVSDQDTYPGQGKVDAVQTVKSTYKLIESGSSGSGSSGSTDSGSSGSGATAEGGDFTLVTSASNLTAGDYIIIAAANGAYAGNYSYYALTTEKDGTYATMQSSPLSFTSLPTTVSCDDENAGHFVYTLKGNANGFTLTTDLGSLEGGSDSDGAYLYYGNATTWKASYNSTSKGFQLTGTGAYMALRDDISTMGSNNYPMFAASTSSGTVVMHMYKRGTSGTTTCSHSSTSTNTVPATCTTAGSTTVTCNSCGAVVSTTTIPQTGHNITYTSNGDGTHKLYCSNCNGTGSEACTFISNVCKYCGYTNSSSGSTETTGDVYRLVQSASDLTAGDYLILVTPTGSYAGDYSHYIMLTTKDSNYSAMQSEGLNFSSLPSGLTLDPSGKGTYVFTLKGNANGFTLSNANGSLEGGVSGTSVYLKYGTASTWKASYNSSKYGFTLNNGTVNIVFRDDLSTTGANGAPLFVSDPSTGATYIMHMYKKSGEESTECTHANTSTSTTAATCTAAGKTVETCDDCGEVINTTTIPAQGHNYKYTSNNNGTHKITCSRCSYSSSANCTMVNNTCSYCGYTVAPELPEEPEVPVAELTDGKYVIAANVDGTYYAMSNAFASKINGTVIKVTDGKVAAEDAVGYVIELEETSSGWTISDGNGNYVKYNSSTNLAKTSDAYAWSISEGTNGTWRVAAQTTGRGLVFRAKTYNQFGGYSTTNCTEGSAEYFDIEFLPIDGEIIEPELPECTHENTETVTEDPTCTEAGTNTVICADCGEIISTTTVPATGHDYSYVGNGDGTHTGTCDNCGDTDSGDCTDPEGVCDVCGADNTPEEPELPEVPVAELTDGQYVVAAYVDGKYYAMSNAFAGKIAGTEITVVDGKVPAAEAEGYVITLTSAEGGWIIEGPDGTYLKYNSSTNLAKATEAYVWNITEGTNGTWRVAAQTEGRGLVFRAKTYNQFGGYSTSNCTEGSAEYFDIEFLPIDGEISEPELPECTHENTETVTEDPTCTEAGTNTVICADCGEIISTTTVPATGHDYSYVGNGDGTHTGTCDNCGDTDSGDCTDPEGVCGVCGADNTPEEPELPEVPVAELTEGRYVVAAYVDGKYYAMSNAFAGKIAGTEITVVDGKVPVAAAEGYVITLTSAEGGWIIEGPDGTYLKYNSSTNLAKATEAYVWNITEGTNGTWRVAAQTEGRGLVFRAKTYNQFGGYSTSNCTEGSAEYFDIEFLPVDGEIAEPETFNVNIRHSLNLANDISINYVVTMDELAGYSDFYLEIDIPTYEGNTYVGSEKVIIEPVAKGDYYYFTLEGMTAVQMNDMLTATLFASKDGKQYASEADVYSIGTYAYNQLEKSTSEAELKNLCAELLRYGSKAQTFKGYRTDSLVDKTMTAAQKALLVNLDEVTFGNNNLILDDLAAPTVTWGGKSLDLNTKVVLRMVVNLSDYKGDMNDLSARVSYVDLTGEEITVEIKEYSVYDASRNFYVFDFAELCAAELRTVVSAAIYEGDTQVSATLKYSCDTYGNGKTGTLLVACQALMAYSDAALIYFTK